MSDEGGGIILGRHFDDETQRIGGKIVYEGERHLLLFGPNGTGKGTRFLIPNLLSIKGRSILVIDPKGELAAVTAAYRHRAGDDVKILDPFGKLHEAVKNSDDHRYLIEHGLTTSAGFNPLSTLDSKSPQTFYDDAAALGEALIKIEGKDPHWTESAQGLIVALVMWEKLKNGDDANLENVRRLLTEADEFKRTFDKKGKATDEIVRGLSVTAADMVEEGGYEVASLAARFTERSSELASIRSTADTQTRWILSPPMREDLKKPGVDFRKLKERPTTCYVILPAERMRTHSVYLRLVVVSALRALYRPGGLRTLMLIDEMPALGHLAPLEDAFGLVRGYKVQIAGICQDLNQLKALYNERWESFLANAGVVQGLTPNDLTTAKWMSERAGITTMLAPSSSESRPAHGGPPTESTSWGQVRRPLYLPQDLMGFAEGTGLHWLAGMANGVRFFAPPYWKIDQAAARASRNPYYEG
jgi:type IV secretion system protein VirD4